MSSASSFPRAATPSTWSVDAQYPKAQGVDTLTTSRAQPPNGTLPTRASSAVAEWVHHSASTILTYTGVLKNSAAGSITVQCSTDVAAASNGLVPHGTARRRT